MSVEPFFSDRQLSSDTEFLATLTKLSNPISSEEYILWDVAPINPGGHFRSRTSTPQRSLGQILMVHGGPGSLDI